MDIDKESHTTLKITLKQLFNLNIKVFQTLLSQNNQWKSLTGEIEENKNNVFFFNGWIKCLISEPCGQFYVHFDSPCPLYSLSDMVILSFHCNVKWRDQVLSIFFHGKYYLIRSNPFLLSSTMIKKYRGTGIIMQDSPS